MHDLRLVLPRFSYRAEMDGVVEWELCPVLTGRVAGVAPEPGPDPAEVEDVRWVAWEAFAADVLSGGAHGVDVVPRAGGRAGRPRTRPVRLADGRPRRPPARHVTSPLD